MTDRHVHTDTDTVYLDDAESAAALADLGRLLYPDDAVVSTRVAPFGTLMVIMSMTDAPAARVTFGCCTLIQRVSSLRGAPA
jgi:hypothetical protein